jgi:predicted RNA-binding Zn-ribbon protein involved in translation (DUF1610 family)
MQTFICPQCGHRNKYDPWTGSAHCDHCGFEPPPDRSTRGQRAREPIGAHQALLNELLAYWNNTHSPRKGFSLETSEEALAFFEQYQRTLGEDPHLHAGRHMGYVRNYHPARAEILTFVGAYLLLVRGDRATASLHLRSLTMMSPEFADAWIWLTATTDDPAERRDYLENALLHEPANPLARDAMSILRGKVKPSGERNVWRLSQETTTTQCPKCGGALHYEPGATEVACPYCGYQLPLEESDILEQDAPLLGDLQLKRRYGKQRWKAARRVIHCTSCSAELTLSSRLAERCPFCGSTNVLVQDNVHPFEKPDGLLPFRIKKEEAQAAIETAQHSGLRAIKTWLTGTQQQVTTLEGIYLPFWAFDGFVEIRTWSTKDPRQRTPPRGAAPTSDMMMFDNLLFPGVRIPPPDLLKRVLPFEVKAMTTYEPRLLADWPAQLYHRDVEMAVRDANNAMLARARRRSPPLVTTESSSEFGSPTYVRRSFQVASVTYQLTLLPIWVSFTQEGNSYRLVLVNGQTGKVIFGPKVAAG